MARILALAMLAFCGPIFAADPFEHFLEQKRFTTRSNALSASTFIAESKILVTSSLTPDARGTVQLWDSQTGSAAGNVPGETSGVFSLAASPDGKYLACGGDGHVAIYDSSAKTELTRVVTPSGRVLALAFAPGAFTLAIAGDGKQIHLLDRTSSKLLESWTAHDEAITALAFAPDGKRLYSASYDGSVKIWEIPGKTPVQKLVANGGRIHGLALSSDGKVLVAACAGNPEGEAKAPEVAVWDLENGKQRKSLRDGEAAFTCVQISSTGSLIAAAKADGWVVAWTPEGVPRSRLRAHRSRVTSLAFSPDGGSLATTSWEAEARLWDLPRWPAPAALPGEFTNPTTLVYHAQAHELIVGGLEKALQMVDPSGKKPARQLQLKTESTQALAISPDGKVLASAGGRNDPGPGRAIRVGRFGIQPPPVAKPELITLWGPESAKELRILAGHQGLINALSFSPDSRLLASGSADKTVRLWDVAEGVEKLQLIGHTSSVVALAFQKGGACLASGAEDGSVLIWDLRTGHEKKVFQAHAQGLNGLAYSPDGAFLATSSAGHGVAAIALWDAQTAENRWLLSYKGAYLGDVTFSPDGRFLLAVGGFFAESGVVRILDVAAGRSRIDLVGGKAHLASICFSPDGKSLFSAGLSTADKGELLHWSLPPLRSP
jgi:WD40 repeat protein